jgi:catechol 2,3-dioxygenase-like lactoylglutathione lyase family enzyme
MTAPVTIASLDHIVFTVASIEAACDFYVRTLGMTVETFEGGRTALRFGDQKINLHLAGHEFEPKATTPLPGSADVCFLTEDPIEGVLAHVRGLGIEIIQGPVPRTGATGPLNSIYFRDPDGNLIEVANRVGA